MRRRAESISGCFIIALMMLLGSAMSLEAQRTRADLNLIRSTFFGLTNNIGYLLDVTTDAQGFVYGTGWCLRMQTTPGVYAPGSAGRNEVMVFKMDPALGQVVWATYVGGAADDAGGSIVVTPSGEVIVGGYTQSTNFPFTNTGSQPPVSGSQAYAFVLKLSADGSQLMFCTLLGTIQIRDKGLESAERGAIICTNNSGSIFATATSINIGWGVTGNCFQFSSFGNTDIVYSKLSQNGQILYGTYFGGERAEIASDICCVQNKIYISGSTGSAGLPLHAGKNVDPGDGFILLADDNNSNVAPRRCMVIGTGAIDNITALCYDPLHQRMLFVGTFEGSNATVTTTFQKGHNAGGVLSCIDTALVEQGFYSVLGLRVVPRSLVMNLDGSIYIGSYVTKNGTAPVSLNPWQDHNQGDFDAALTVVDSSGSKLLYGTYLCGVREDYSAVTIALSHSGCFLRVLVGLTTHSENFVTTADAYQPDKLNDDEDQPALCLFTTLEDTRLLVNLSMCTNEVSATINSVCNPLKVVWDFGDGVKDSSGSSVRHRYARSGVYTMKVRMYYYEPDTITVVEEVPLTGAVKVDAGPDTTVCAKNPRTQLFAKNAVICSWSPPGLFDNPRSLKPTINPSTNTTVYVHATDLNGCESDDTLTIFVNNTVASIRGDTIVCLGQPVTLHGGGGLSVRWILDSAKTSIAGSDIILNLKKTTRVKCIVTNGACVDSVIQIIRVVTAPILSMPVPQVVCPGVTTELKTLIKYPPNCDSSIISYTWSPNTNIDDIHSAHPSVWPSQNTWYKLDVLTGAGCILRDSVYMTMRTAKVTKIISDTGMCQGQALQLWAQGADSYRWSPPDGLSDPNIPSPVCTAGQNTTYTVYTTNGPCLDSHTVHVEVRELPVFSMMKDTAVCRGSFVRLFVQPAASGSSCMWWPADGVDDAFALNTMARVQQSRTYYVMVRSSPFCAVIDSVFVRADSTVAVDAGSDQELCPGEVCAIDLSAIADSAASYVLEPPLAQYNSLSKRFEFSATQEGVYHVRAIKGVCESLDSMSLRLKPAVSAAVVVVDSVVCAGQSARIQIALPNAASIVWLRDGVEDTLVDNAYAASIVTRSIDTATRFRFHVRRNGECDFDSSISIRPALTVSLKGMQNLIGCRGDTVALSLEAQGAVSARWTPSQGLSDDGILNPRVVFGDVRNYDLVLRSAEGCEQRYTMSVGTHEGSSVVFHVDSIVGTVGDTAHLRVHATAPEPLRLGRDLILQVNARALWNESSLESEIKDRVLSIHIPVHQLNLIAGEQTVAEIPVRILASSDERSVLHLVVDSAVRWQSSICDAYELHAAELLSLSCLGPARGVEFGPATAFEIRPTPALNHIHLQYRLAPDRAAAIRVYSGIGVQLRELWIQGSGEQETVSMDISDLAHGVLLVELDDGYQAIHRTIVKQDP